MSYYKEILLELGVAVSLMTLGCGHFLLPSKVSSLRNKSKENEQILGVKGSVKIYLCCLSSHPFLLGPPPLVCSPSHLPCG